MQILLVEDHLDSAQVMSKILKNKGFEVKTAADCKGAMTAFESGLFHLVMLDIKLPDGDGCDLLCMLAQICPVKSIAMSACPLYENFNRVRAAGFDRYLHKPLAARDIYETIDELFPNPARGVTENPLSGSPITRRSTRESISRPTHIQPPRPDFPEQILSRDAVESAR
jgi:DNA-binding response OmpR family regulator